MTSATAAAPPFEAESTTRPDEVRVNSTTVLIHILVAQALWFGAIAFGIYSATA